MKRMIISAADMWQVKKPRFNAWQVGHGPQKNKRAYNRQRAKEQLRKEEQ